MPRNRSEKEIALAKVEPREFEGTDIDSDVLKAYRRLRKKARSAKVQQKRRSNEALLAAATGALSAWSARYVYEEGRNGKLVKKPKGEEFCIDPDLAAGAALAVMGLMQKEANNDGEK